LRRGKKAGRQAKLKDERSLLPCDMDIRRAALSTSGTRGDTHSLRRFGHPLRIRWLWRSLNEAGVAVFRGAKKREISVFAFAPLYLAPAFLFSAFLPSPADILIAGADCWRCAPHTFTLRVAGVTR